MRKPVIAFTTAALAFAVAAQQPRLCLDPQLLNGLVFLGRSDMKADTTPGQASFMQDVKLSEQLVLIGSAERNDGLATVAYRTSLTPAKAYAAAADALAVAGWLPEPSMSSATFRVEGDAPRDQMLCRDGARRSVLVRDVDGLRYVNVVAFPEARRRECGADPVLEGMSAMSSRNLLPRLRFPEGTNLAQPTGGGGGSNTLFTTTLRIISMETPASLLEYLAEQLDRQGWEPDANWSASGSAGSTWHRLQDGEPVAGTLEIFRAGEGTYEVDFTVAMPE